MSLPPLPSHPERLTQRWSEEETKVLQAYGQACREQALEEAAKACESAIASIWDYHDDGRKQIGTTVCNNLAVSIRKIKEQS